LSTTIEKTIILGQNELLTFCGRNDNRLREIDAGLAANLLARGNEIVVSGAPDDVETASKLIENLLTVQRKTGRPLSQRQLRLALRQTDDAADSGQSISEIFLDAIPLPNRTKYLAPCTAGQKRYVNAIKKSDVVFAIGPAGTGKTYLAVAMAVCFLAEGRARRIILVRPAVEAGESLGFLPGDITAKFDPFVRPLYDALYDMMEPDRVKEYLETGVIEIAPLAFMRGRTLNDSFVILDEGQNTTVGQMKMFLTRLGYNSVVVITGDVTQIDLPKGKQSGLVHAQKVLDEVEGIEFVRLGERDVVRHELVQKIILAYDKYEKSQHRHEHV
jgi:phosphate starvation-inducible PhoH-like protein